MVSTHKDKQVSGVKMKDVAWIEGTTHKAHWLIFTCSHTHTHTHSLCGHAVYLHQLVPVFNRLAGIRQHGCPVLPSRPISITAHTAHPNYLIMTDTERRRERERVGGRDWINAVRLRNEGEPQHSASITTNGRKRQKERQKSDTGEHKVRESTK